jgi:hypothetical protein
LSRQIIATPDRPFQFDKSSWLFIGAHHKTPSVIAVRISNPDCPSLRIHG